MGQGGLIQFIPSATLSELELPSVVWCLFSILTTLKNFTISGEAGSLYHKEFLIYIWLEEPNKSILMECNVIMYCFILIGICVMLLRGSTV